jgi:predicted acetyltransferase
MFKVTPLNDEQDSQHLGEILCQCFKFPTEKWPEYRDGIGVENFRIIRSEAGILGGLAVYRMAQYFGGKAVKMGGVAAVGVAPEFRGSGAAKALLSETLRELYAEGVAISTLYPATQRLYRAVGYEQAGMRCQWELPLTNLALRAPLRESLENRVCSLHRLKNPDISYLKESYRHFAETCDGYLDRHPFLWGRIVHEEQPFYAYHVRDRDRVLGYIVYQQESCQSEIVLTVRDWVALTPEAMQTLWAFISSHRSQVARCRWYGGVIEPRLLLLPEQTAKIVDSIIWFLRIVDVVKALSLRGYPVGVEAELDFELSDDLIPENQGKWRLSVAEGKAEVRKCDRADLSLSCRGFASLYSGLYSPRQLQQMGFISGTEAALAIATRLFPQNMPAMADFF